MAKEAKGRCRRRRGLRLGIAALAVALLAGCGSTSSPATRAPVTPAPKPTATAPLVSATPSPTPTSPAAPVSPTPAPMANGAYVALRNGELFPVDLTTGLVGTPVQLGHAPAAMAIAPDGQTAYIAATDAAEVTAVDLATGSEKQIAVPAGGGSLTAIAISPDGSTAYVAVSQGASAPGSIIPVSLSSGSAGTPIAAGTDPAGIAITPDGSTAYVADQGAATVTPVALASGSAGTPIPVADDCDAIALSPDGGIAYVLGAGGGDTLTPITLASSPAQDTVGSPISLGSGIGVPAAIAVVPDGDSAFVVGSTGVEQLALPSGTATWQAPPAQYTAVAVSTDGSVALLGADNLTEGGGGGLLVVNVTTDAATGTVPLEAVPAAVGFAS